MPARMVAEFGQRSLCPAVRKKSGKKLIDDIVEYIFQFRKNQVLPRLRCVVRVFGCVSCLVRCVLCLATASSVREDVCVGVLELPCVPAALDTCSLFSPGPGMHLTLTVSAFWFVRACVWPRAVRHHLLPVAQGLRKRGQRPQGSSLVALFEVCCRECDLSCGVTCAAAAQQKGIKAGHYHGQMSADDRWVALSFARVAQVDTA